MLAYQIKNLKLQVIFLLLLSSLYLFLSATDYKPYRLRIKSIKDSNILHFKLKIIFLCHLFFKLKDNASENYRMG
jgi:hypothetical protein